MKPKVYLETSFIGYLTMWPSRDAIVLAHQQLTIEWWERRRAGFELFTSEIVVAEAERGDQEAVRARRQILRETQRLSASPAAELLVPELLAATRLPARVFADMAHVALATVHGMQYLLTWNCRHIANATIQRPSSRLVAIAGTNRP